MITNRRNYKNRKNTWKLYESKHHRKNNNKSQPNTTSVALSNTRKRKETQQSTAIHKSDENCHRSNRFSIYDYNISRSYKLKIKAIKLPWSKKITIRRANLSFSNQYRRLGKLNKNKFRGSHIVVKCGAYKR